MPDNSLPTLAPANLSTAKFSMGNIDNNAPKTVDNSITDKEKNADPREKDESNMLMMSLVSMAALTSAIGLGIYAFKKIDKLNSQISSLQDEISDLTSKKQGNQPEKHIIEKILSNHNHSIAEYSTSEDGIKTLISHKYTNSEGIVLQTAKITPLVDGKYSATIDLADGSQLILSGIDSDIPDVLSGKLPTGVEITQTNNGIVRKLTPNPKGSTVLYQNGENSIILDIIHDSSGNITKITTQGENPIELFNVHEGNLSFLALNEQDNVSDSLTRLNKILNTIIPLRRENPSLVQINSVEQAANMFQNTIKNVFTNNIFVKLFETAKSAIDALPFANDKFINLNQLALKLKGHTESFPMLYSHQGKIIDSNFANFSGNILSGECEFSYSNGALTNILNYNGISLSKLLDKIKCSHGSCTIDAWKDKTTGQYSFTTNNPSECTIISDSIKLANKNNPLLMQDDDILTFANSIINPKNQASVEESIF